MSEVSPATAIQEYTDVPPVTYDSSMFSETVERAMSPAQPEAVIVHEFNQLSSSPVQTARPPQQLDFPDAIRAVIDGEKITKVEWNDPRIFIELKDDRLQIHKANDTWHILQVSAGDMFGDDWYVI